MFRKVSIFLMFFFIISMVSMTSLAPIVWAAEKYTIKEMTPEVMSALEDRRSRYDELQRIKQQGKAGENNRGYVDAFSDEADVKRLVDLENKDRKIIYQTIARQNNLESAIATIEKVFAQTQRDNAEPGEKIQLEDGQWSTK
ncbi:MAG: DUF1318 domain-containing protein [Candidatus Aceula meridiana]|nr:DUF1318 domain-containing protein [Candidatus Aceula meridiana]